MKSYGKTEKKRLKKKEKKRTKFFNLGPAMLVEMQCGEGTTSWLSCSKIEWSCMGEI